MTELTGQGTAPVAAGTGRRRGIGAALGSGRPVVVGVLAGGLLAAVLIALFCAFQLERLARDHERRIVVIEAMALAEATAQIDDDPARVQQTLVRWLAALGEGDARVIRLRGTQMLASTFGADASAGAPPRRLTRDEKPLYDDTQLLRAAFDANRDTGAATTRELKVAAEDGRVTATVPYVRDDAVAGSVTLSAPTDVARPPPAHGMALLATVVPAMLVGLAALRGGGTVPAGRRPWALFAIATAALAVSLTLFAVQQQTRVAATQEAFTERLAAHHGEVFERFERFAGGAAPGAVSRWDVDDYRRPYRVIGGRDAVAGEVLAGEVAELRDSLRLTNLLSAALGLIVLAYFALGGARWTWETLREHRNAYLYVMPAIVGMLVLVFYPFTFGIVLSFTDQTIYTANEPIPSIWVGLANYARILFDWPIAEHTADGWNVNFSNFYWTLFITVMWTVCNVAIGVTVGMLLALALNTTGLRGKTIYRVVLILPWAIPNYITALTWQGMFHPQLGQINQAIQILGGQPVAWFDGVFSSFLTGIATNGWLSFPFMMVVILGALQAIPGDMYEAAKLDGANRWQQFRNITLPLIRPALVPAIIISVVWTFNMFNVIYLVSGGQPAGANEILITEAYKIAFEQYRTGYAAAYSVVIFVILLMYGVFQARATRAYEAA